MAATSDVSRIVEADRQSLGRRRSSSSRRGWLRRLVVGDVVGVGTACLLLILLLDLRGTTGFPSVWTFALFGLVPVLAGIRGSYAWRMDLHLTEASALPFVEVGLAWLIVASFETLLSSRPDSGVLLAACLLAGGSVSAARTLVFRWEVAARERGVLLRPTLVIGAGRVGSFVVKRLLQHPEFGLRPVGYLDDDPLDLADEHRDLPILGGLDDLEAVVASYSIEQVVITFSRTSHLALLAAAERSAAIGVDVSLVPRLYEKTRRTATVRYLGGLPVIDMHIVDPEKSRYLRFKYAFDRVAALLLLILASPLLALIALAIRLTMGSPVFFRQTRVGRNGVSFVMLKFRTMATGDSEGVVPLPPDTAPGGIEGSTDRRTRLGRFLRRSSLDELPQLVNVLRGEMSIVGPRPERPQFVSDFIAEVHGYDRRHRVKGGITGWAQVSGLRGQTSISERAEWDNYYIENVSAALDAKICALTVLALARGFLPSGRAGTRVQ